MRGRLQGTQAASHAFPQHHPIFDIGIGCFGSRRKLDHRIRFVRQAQAKRVDGDPGVIQLIPEPLIVPIDLLCSFRS